MKKQTKMYITVAALTVATALSSCSKLEDSKNSKGVTTNTSSSSETESDTTQDVSETIDTNDLEGTNLGHWARAMGSILVTANNTDPFYFGAYSPSAFNKQGVIQMLEEGWDIASREDLILQVDTLLQSGHREYYIEDADVVASYSEEEFEAALQELDEESQLYYRVVKYNHDKWGKKGAIAWDMCRISHLAQWGYIAGYVTKEEAHVLVQPAAQFLKDTFSTWEEVQMNWLDGYAWWAEVDPETDSEYLKRLEIYQTLATEQVGGQPLYDESLFSTDIQLIDGLSYEDLVAEASNK